MTEQRQYFELHCPACRWRQTVGVNQMGRWLRSVRKLKAGQEPEIDVLVELFRAAAGLFVCPECDNVGLRPTPIDDAADWPEDRPCSACGKAIAPERLAAVPGVTLCAACQGREESGQGAGETEYCPKCGSPMALRLSRSPGVSRYVMACTGNPPCRL